MRESYFSLLDLIYPEESSACRNPSDAPSETCWFMYSDSMLAKSSSLVCRCLICIDSFRAGADIYFVTSKPLDDIVSAFPKCGRLGLFNFYEIFCFLLKTLCSYGTSKSVVDLYWLFRKRFVPRLTLLMK